MPGPPPPTSSASLSTNRSPLPNGQTRARKFVIDILPLYFASWGRDAATTDVDSRKEVALRLYAGQRSNPEANRLVEWMLTNGIVVEETKQDYTVGGQTFEKGSYVVPMAQARRGLLWKRGAYNFVSLAHDAATIDRAFGHLETLLEAMAAGVPGGRAALVCAAVLAGQASIGWSNDWLDADREARAERTHVRRERLRDDRVEADDAGVGAEAGDGADERQPLQVGRDRSVKALDRAVRTSQPVALVTQRSSEQEEISRRFASKVADNYVHDNPWTAIGIAAGVGVVLGMLISRR